MQAVTQGKKLPQLTIGLIAISLITAALTELGANRQVVVLLLVNWYELSQFELWRLVTPIFLHFGLLHLVFNMLWLWQLGRAIEMRFGTLKLLMLVLITGILSNLSELWWSTPFFGGMSGVVYALLGYVWMQGKYNPWSGLFVSRQLMAMMLAWYLLCWTGLFGSIANMAHTVGLLSGLLWGYLECTLLNKRH